MDTNSTPITAPTTTPLAYPFDSEVMEFWAQQAYWHLVAHDALVMHLR
ncbi:hypothetical protein R5M92_08810 [Halomonas sp. Bachu 37]